MVSAILNEQIYVFVDFYMHLLNIFNYSFEWQ